MKRGYKPAIEQSEIRNAVRDVDAFSGFIPDLLQQIHSSASNVTVTRAELKRDFGYTDSALRFCQKMKLLVPIRRIVSRPMYDLAKALRIRVVYPAILLERRIRTKRKHCNIITVQRELLNRVIED